MSAEPATAPAPATVPSTAAEEKKPAPAEAVPEPEPAPATTAADEARPAVAEAPSEVKTEDKPAAEEPKTVAEEKPAEPAPTPAPAPALAVAEAEAEKEAAPPASPLSKFFAELPAAIKEAGYDEMWGIPLLDEKHVPTSIILEKFLRANSKDVAKAKAQLIDALKWRKATQPRKLLEEVEFDKAKFGELGYVTVYPKSETHEKEIITWNIYGSVKDKKATFGDVDEFVKWRAALMELSVIELDLASATTPIPPEGVDPYRMLQVHDYLNVSFLRMDPIVKAASKQTIQTFSIAYPELLKEKFFVNVPVVMGWVFAAMKLFLSPDTVKKFHPLSYGSSLAGELMELASELPTAYGGKGKDIKEGLMVKYAAVAEPPAPETAEEAKPVDTKAPEPEAEPAEAKPAEPAAAEPAVPETKPVAGETTETKAVEVKA